MSDHKGWSKRWVVTGVLTVFLSGVVIGGFGAATLMRMHVLHVMRGGPPPRMHERIANRLTKGCDLTREQQERVNDILDDFEVRFHEMEQKSREEVKAVMRGMEAEIRTLLTPEQQARYDANLQEMRKEFERRGRDRRWKDRR